MSTAEAWTVGRLLTWTADYLKKHGSTSPRLDAEVLLAEAKGCQRIELYTAFNEEPSEQIRAAFKEMVRRRAEGTPVAYLVGRKEFYSLPFEVNPDVLIPRPETEHLVVEAIDRAKQLTGQSPAQTAAKRAALEQSGDQPTQAETQPDESTEVVAGGSGEYAPPSRPTRSFAGLRVLDVGTGSGIVAISLAKSLPGAQITAVDISPAALALAARNVAKHEVGGQVKLVESDLLAALGDSQFDLIVSNPPYISEAEYAELDPGVRKYEPRGALVAGPTGAETIERLLAQSAQHLKPGGWLLFELSPMIADKVVAMVDRSLWTEPTVIKDLAGLARVVAVSRR
ncbi:MAG: N5-glutamine methyltransferase family protein [Aureliella sp.]